MSNTQAKRDDNWQPVIMGETDDASRETRPLIVDPVTDRLLVNTTGTVTETETAPTDTTKSNPSLVLTQTDNVVASTKTLTMTIGATPYVATLSYNASGQFLSISAWS